MEGGWRGVGDRGVGDRGVMVIIIFDWVDYILTDCTCRPLCDKKMKPAYLFNS